MAEYYKTEQKRTNSHIKKETPYKKIFFRQLIAAILCFLIIKYAFNDDLRKKIKEISNNNINFSFFENLKINGVKIYENDKNIQ